MYSFVEFVVAIVLGSDNSKIGESIDVELVFTRLLFVLKEDSVGSEMFFIDIFFLIG